MNGKGSECSLSPLAVFMLIRSSGQGRMPGTNRPPLLQAGRYAHAGESVLYTADGIAMIHRLSGIGLKFS